MWPPGYPEAPSCDFTLDRLLNLAGLNARLRSWVNSTQADPWAGQDGSWSASGSPQEQFCAPPGADGGMQPGVAARSFATLGEWLGLQDLLGPRFLLALRRPQLHCPELA